MKKIIYLLLIFAIIFAALSLSCFASGDEANITTSEDTAINISEESAASEEAMQESEAAQGNGDGAEENIFAQIYNLALTYSGEIFALLACLFSAVMMLCYKNGILPLIKGGISALSQGVSVISGEAKKQSENSIGFADAIKDRVAFAEEALEKIGNSIDALEEKLETASKAKSEREVFLTVLEEEVNMLYEVFMAASLPEFQKDRIARSVSLMREKINGVSADEDN